MKTKIIRKKPDPIPDEHTKLEEDIWRVIDQIHSLSGENVNTRSFKPTLRNSEAFPALANVDFNAYYGVLSNLYGILQPLLRERFVDNLPKTLVCIMSKRQDCGLEAELTKAVSIELGKPVLMYLSSLRSQMCTRSDIGDEEPSSFLRSYLTTTQLDGLQEMFVNMLAELPLSGNLVKALNGLVDTAVIYLSEYILTLIRTPLEYVKIALQFGIKIPSLDNGEHCDQGKSLLCFLCISNPLCNSLKFDALIQICFFACSVGDLKQLIMW